MLYSSTYAKICNGQNRLPADWKRENFSDKIESLRMELRNQKVSGSIEYSSYVQGTGWLDWTESGNDSGTPKRKEGGSVQDQTDRRTGEAV